MCAGVVRFLAGLAVPCTFASRVDMVIVGLPGAAQDCLRACVPGAQPGRLMFREPATQAQRDELTLTTGKQIADMGPWINDLSAQRREFEESAGRTAELAGPRPRPQTMTPSGGRPDGQVRLTGDVPRSLTRRPPAGSTPGAGRRREYVRAPSRRCPS